MTIPVRVCGSVLNNKMNHVERVWFYEKSTFFSNKVAKQKKKKMKSQI